MSQKKGQTGLRWFIVRKAKTQDVRGVIVDCVKASDVQTAFEWALSKWQDYISRSHDSASPEDSYCMFVEPIEFARFPAVTMSPGGVLAVTKEEIERFLKNGYASATVDAQL